MKCNNSAVNNTVYCTQSKEKYIFNASQFKYDLSFHIKLNLVFDCEYIQMFS